MKQIPLTQGKIALVDDDIYELVKDFKWCVFRSKRLYYAVRHSSTKDDPEGKRHPILLHHIVIGRPPRGFEVDHIDGDGLNNQKANLRIVTHRINGQNLKTHRIGRLVGCYYDKARKKWRTQIRINGKKKYIGLFKTEQEAHEAYMKALDDLS